MEYEDKITIHYMNYIAKDIIMDKVETIEAVECVVCGKLHRVDDNRFVSIHGNICIGMNGGVVGNNLDESGRVCKVTIVCSTHDCLEGLFKEIFNDYRKNN